MSPPAFILGCTPNLSFHFFLSLLLAEFSQLSGEENKERFLQEVSIMWSCTFHENVVKLIGYTLSPDHFIATKLYELDLFTLVHHPTESISPLLILKLCGSVCLSSLNTQPNPKIITNHYRQGYCIGHVLHARNWNCSPRPQECQCPFGVHSVEWDTICLERYSSNEKENDEKNEKGVHSFSLILLCAP